MRTKLALSVVLLAVSLMMAVGCSEETVVNPMKTVAPQPTDNTRNITCHPPVPTVLFPSECGLNLVMGQTYEIRWENYTPEPSEGMWILLFETTNNTYQLIAARTENDGSYFWTVPYRLRTDLSYIIQVKTGGENIYQADVSDCPFNIVDPARVIYPSDAGIVLQRGLTYNIQWEGYDPSEPITILLWNINSHTYQVIVRGTANDGSYQWTVPNNINTNPDYIIQVRCGGDSFPHHDVSDHSFRIQ